MEKEIGKVKVSDLKEEYGTPLYVFDEGKIKEKADEYLSSFRSDLFKTEIIYASKAFQVKEMLRMVEKKGLSLDVVSYGEYYTAKKCGFPVERIYFHGNNKSEEEIESAIEDEIGELVVDNADELTLVDKITRKKQKSVRVLFRINCGVDAHTHQYICTSYIDSKFGIAYASEEYNKMKEIVQNNPLIVLEGFHSHIGSQIFNQKAFFAAFDKFIPILKEFKRPLVLDIGGGFGVRYTKEDSPMSTKELMKSLIQYIEKKLSEEKISVQKICIEPGRSLVAEAGSTLYTIGFKKKTPNRQYYFVDGGMSDNIRPALYGAKYEADIANKIGDPKEVCCCVAGKCCESGDILIKDIYLQEAERGDILIVYTTGAYGYTMASNYNKAPLPAVVFVENGKSRLVVRRQSFDELIEREI